MACWQKHSVMQFRNYEMRGVVTLWADLYGGHTVNIFPVDQCTKNYCHNRKKLGISFFLRSCLWCRSSCIAYIITRSDEILFRKINTLWTRFASTVCPQVIMVKQARSIHDGGAASSSHWRSNDGLGLAKTRKPWLTHGNCGANADWQYGSSAWNIDGNINTISLSPTFDVHRFGWWFGIEIMQI